MQKIELKNDLGKVFFTLEFKQQEDLIYANWIGFVNVDNVIEGATKVLDAIESTHCSNFINDNRELNGPWKNANDWIENIWTPKAVGAGLRNFAFIVSPNIFAELSAKDLSVRLDNVGFEMRTFKDYESALSWIKKNNLAGHIMSE
ncbi:MAG TPA: hypothetical protein VL947_05940 [Cytophagales bacterium]|nr:hypothetical protein [Cytophagales bacterium]